MEVRQYLPLEVVLEFYRVLFPNSEGEIYIYICEIINPGYICILVF